MDGYADNQLEWPVMSFRRCNKCGSDFDDLDRHTFCPHELRPYRKISINFPVELFDKIRQRAKADGVAISHKAVELVACGLRDYEDSEAHEPDNAARRLRDLSSV
jgi:hypothetical protein